MIFVCFGTISSKEKRIMKQERYREIQWQCWHSDYQIPLIHTRDQQWVLKRWVNSSHTHNFWYLYAFILILISYSHFTSSKFEVLIALILNNTHVVDFDSPWLNIYENHKISVICVRTPQYSVGGCVFALLAVFVFFFFS